MDYTELKIEVASDVEAEIATAYLADFPFESFDVADDALLAYIQSAQLDKCREKVVAMLDEQAFAYSFEEVATTNWNALWESDFEEVDVDGRVLIRAPFHAPREGYEGMQIVVQPRMSFGTGHHATTQMMVEMLLGAAVEGHTLLDMGSGTGVLAIVAARLGAERVLAVEIDDMAEGSVRENIAMNGVAERVESVCGDVSAIVGRSFDVVLANINRNILLADMASYVDSLVTGGALIMSGFFVDDCEAITSAARALGLTPARTLTRDGWASLEFIK